MSIYFNTNLPRLWWLNPWMAVKVLHNRLIIIAEENEKLGREVEAAYRSCRTIHYGAEEKIEKLSNELFNLKAECESRNRIIKRITEDNLEMTQDLQKLKAKPKSKTKRK